MRMDYPEKLALEAQIFPEGLMIRALRNEFLVIREPQLILEILTAHLSQEGKDPQESPLLDQRPAGL